MIATCPGLLSVGTRVCETPYAPLFSMISLRYGATRSGAPGTIRDASALNAKSARRPSPEYGQGVTLGISQRDRVRTDYEHEALGLRLWELVLAHAMDNGTREVAVENGGYVKQVEEDSEDKETGY
jgi:hypothetical protein